MEDNRGMRFDIFDRQVCRGLELSQGMKTRARVYQSFGNLDVYLMAPPTSGSNRDASTKWKTQQD
jgi:hypothetical protein